jgi:hypothetical protein
MRARVANLVRSQTEKMVDVTKEFVEKGVEQ